MPPSLLPFLYQTPTIQRSCAVVVPAVLARAAHPAAHIHHRNVPPLGAPQSCTSHRMPSQSRPSSTSTGAAGASVAARSRGRPKSAGNSSLGSTADRRPRRSGPDDVSFEPLPDPDSRWPRMPPNSTLTASEQAKFGEIFTEIGIFDRKPKLDSSPVPSPSPSPGTEVPAPDSLSSNPSAQDDANQSEQSGGMKGLYPASEQAKAASARDAFLARYPPAIQGIARTALGMHGESVPYRGPSESGLFNLGDSAAARFGLKDGGDGVAATGAKTESASRIEAERAIEISRVDALMAKCQSDVKLWQVLEKEVFVIPAKLGLDLDMTSSSTGNTGNTDNTNRADETASRATTTTTTTKPTNDADSKPATGDAAISMHVHGAVYPVLLCAACHRLTSSFSSLSPFAFLLLPHVKSLGMTSYALGASTTLYNETMRLYWSHHGDLQAIADLLDEMDSAGLSPNRETHDFLDKLMKLLDLCDARTESSGGWLAPMMRLPGFQDDSRARLEEWLGRIQNELHRSASADLD